MSDDKQPSPKDTNAIAAAANKTEKNSDDLKSPLSAKVNKTTKTKQPVRTPTNKASNKLGWLALLVALLSAGSAAAGYFWWQQQQTLLLAQMEKQLADSIIRSEQTNKTQTQTLLSQQTNVVDSKLQALVVENSQYQDHIARLEQQIKTLSQQQPEDWLLGEANYLIRIANRTLWFRHDVKATINLLQDADSRLAELNQEQFLPVRAAIYQDLQTLQALPEPNSDAVLLKLMALQQQAQNLPLLVPEQLSVKHELELSDDSADWKENLAKTWHWFIDSFISVRRKGSEKIDPILSAEQQASVNQSLMLKVQLAEWAVTQTNQTLYQKSLQDISSWLDQYYDMTKVDTQVFLSSIGNLSEQIIGFSVPDNLIALSAIQSVLTDYQVPTLEQNLPTESNSSKSPNRQEKQSQQDNEVL